MEFIELLLTLVGAHFICDYVLQTDAIATGKNRLIDPCKFGVDWRYWMASHAATHGFAVGVITSNLWLGVFEFITHWLIDSGKCEKHYGLHTDQFLHLICKFAVVLYVA